MDIKSFYLRVFSVAILTTIIAFLGLVFPLLSTFIWSAPVAVLTAREGLKPGVLAAGLAFLMLAFLISPGWAAVSAIQFGSIGLVLGNLLRKGNSFGRILLSTAGVSLSLTGLIFLLPVIQGSAPGGLAAELSKNTEDVIAIWRDIGFLDNLNQQGISLQEIKETLQTAVNWLIMLLPSMIVISSLGAAFFNFLAARWGLKRKGYPLSEFPGFKKWWVPWYISWSVILGLGLALLGDYVGIRTIFITGVNLVCVHVPVAFIVGLSVLTFLITKIQSTLFRAVIIFVGFFYFPLTVVLLLLVGVFDPLFDFRKIHLKSVRE